MTERDRGYRWWGYATSQGGPLLLTEIGHYAAWRGGAGCSDGSTGRRVHYYGPLVAKLDATLRRGEHHHQEVVVPDLVTAQSFVDRLSEQVRQLAPDATLRTQRGRSEEELREMARGDRDAWRAAWRDHMEQGVDFVREGRPAFHIDVKPDTDYARLCARDRDALVGYGPDGSYPGVTFDLEGPGTARVAVATDGRALALASLRTASSDKSELKDRKAAEAFTSAVEGGTGVGEIQLAEGLVVIAWSPVCPDDLGVANDVAAQLRAAAQLHPPIQLNQKSRPAVGTFARVEPGTYKVTRGRHTHPTGWSCVWMKLTREERGE